MAGYKETFGSNVDYAYGRGTDMTNRIQNSARGFANDAKGLSAMVGSARSASRGIKDLGNSMSDLRNSIANATDPKEILRLTREFENARKASEKLRKSLLQMPFDGLERGFGSLTKGLLKFNAGLLSIGFDFLISSIKRVYELQEKWTHAIGGFNMKLGGMTKGLKGAQQAATQWSSTIRGLTNGDIEQGIQMFGEFTMAIGRTVKAGDGFSKLGIQLARGFGIGGTGAGQILKVFENIGMSADDSAEAMKTSIKAANAAGIPVNMLAEDLSKSVTYMARFGKEGQKTLIQGAAWARKYDISLEQLRQSVEGLDVFDEAAKSSSKLNAAFGTMINSMDLMMEDDPAKRLEMIRQQMLSQGMTYDKLSPKQRRYFSETMKLSEEQTAALLDSQNAGESYADFQAKAEKKQKDELNAKAMMQKMLVKTAQTMYAFGAAFDRVTMAIAKAIRPLLEVLGLAKKGGKDFKGFGGVMENITKTVIEFFESLAGNDKWMGFMRELGKDLQRAGVGLKAFVMDGRAADLVGDIASGMKSFYITVRDIAMKAVPLFRPVLDVILTLSKHIKELAIAWAAMKGFNMVGGMGTVEKIAGMLGGGGGGGKGRGGLMGKVGGLVGGLGGKLGVAGGAGALGAAVGGKAAGIGSSVGAFAGSFLGPIGTAIGAVAGGFVGKAIGKLFETPEVKTQVQEAHERLAKAMKVGAETQDLYTKTVEHSSNRLVAEDNIRKAKNNMLAQMDKQMKDGKGKEIKLNKEQAESLRARADELGMFSKSTKVSSSQLASLGEGSSLTKTQIKALLASSNTYEATLSKLRETSDKILDQNMAQLQISGLASQKNSMSAVLKLNQSQQSLDQAELKKLGGQTKGHKFESADEMMDRFGRAMSQQANPQNSQRARLELDSMQKMKKNNAEAYRQLELSYKIREREKKNAKDQEKLIALETDYAKQSMIISLRRDAMSTEDFMKFKAESPGMSQEAAFDSYLGIRKDALKAIHGDDGYDLLASKPKFMAAGGVVTRATKAIIGEAGPEAVIPLSRMRENLAGGGSSGDSGTVVTQIAEVTLDGQKVGRALVRSSIRRSN